MRAERLGPRRQSPDSWQGWCLKNWVLGALLEVQRLPEWGGRLDPLSLAPPVHFTHWERGTSVEKSLVTIWQSPIQRSLILRPKPSEGLGTPENGGQN